MLASKMQNPVIILVYYYRSAFLNVRLQILEIPFTFVKKNQIEKLFLMFKVENITPLKWSSLWEKKFNSQNN